MRIDDLSTKMKVYIGQNDVLADWVEAQPDGALIEAALKKLQDFKKGDENLDFSGLGIESIPPLSKEILKSIKHINLSDNPFIALPESILDMVNLETLQLNRTKIQKLPDLSSLHHLKQINIEESQLENLPKNVGALKSVEILRLSRNNIRIIPDSIVKMPQLTELYLKFNPITKCPDFGKMPNLKVVELDDQLKVPEPSTYKTPKPRSLADRLVKVVRGLR